VGMSDFEALRLAPPVLEVWATGGRLVSREVVGFALDWPLPAADGIGRVPATPALAEGYCPAHRQVRSGIRFATSTRGRQVRQS
jgi:hypothetical protein